MQQRRSVFPDHSTGLERTLDRSYAAFEDSARRWPRSAFATSPLLTSFESVVLTLAPVAAATSPAVIASPLNRAASTAHLVCPCGAWVRERCPVERSRVVSTPRADDPLDEHLSPPTVSVVRCSPSTSASRPQRGPQRFRPPRSRLLGVGRTAVHHAGVPTAAAGRGPGRPRASRRRGARARRPSRCSRSSGAAPRRRCRRPPGFVSRAASCF
jgi:hypothetical protein